jgi:hypothetical protein
MYPLFVFYTPEDGHMVGGNKQEFTAYINQFQYTCAFVGNIIVYIATVLSRFYLSR